MEKSEKIALLSAANNGGLSALKLVLALLSGSVALIADALHSFTDVVASLAVWVGLKISKRRSRTFPYGLYKVENFVSLITSLAIFFAGYEIVREVLSRSRGTLTHLPVALVGVVVTIAATFAFSRYELKVGREIGSPSLIADAQHVKTDMFSSAVIFVGLAGGLLEWPLDKPAALVVVFFIARAGWSVLSDAVRVLLDASLDFETLDTVKAVLLGEPLVKELNGLWGRNSGRYKFIEAHITVNEVTLERAHRVSRMLGERIREKVSNVDHILIHYKPVQKELVRYALPLIRDQKALSEHFGEAPFFEIVTVRAQDEAVVDRQIFENTFVDMEKGKGIYVAEWLANNGVDKVFLKRKFHGKGPEYVFSNAGIGTTITESDTVDEVLASQSV